MKRDPRAIRLVALSLLAATLAFAACGGGGDEDETMTTTSTVAAACEPIEETDQLTFGEHEEREFTAADYDTNPPSGGDHNQIPLEAGSFYPDPPPLGQSVHLLEHGAVIGWTNGLSEADQTAVEDEFNRLFGQGYYQLAVVENPDLEVPFALSAWGALQRCESIDTEAIEPFVEQWYASPASGESALACEGDARRLPPC